MQHKIVVAAVAMFMVVGVRGLAAAERTWTRSAILEAADREAMRLGYDIEHASVWFDHSNSMWETYLARKKGDSANQMVRQVAEKLTAREYWAVYYTDVVRSDHSTPPFRGDLFIFVDPRAIVLASLVVE